MKKRFTLPHLYIFPVLLWALAASFGGGSGWDWYYYIWDAGYMALLCYRAIIIGFTAAERQLMKPVFALMCYRLLLNVFCLLTGAHINNSAFVAITLIAALCAAGFYIINENIRNANARN